MKLCNKLLQSSDLSKKRKENIITSDMTFLFYKKKKKETHGLKEIQSNHIDIIVRVIFLSFFHS